MYTLSWQNSSVPLLNHSPLVRGDLRDYTKQYDKTEDDLKAVQNVGQIIGEVLKRLDDERCMTP
jgi:ATP-dependent 26S proteasome regulatory subunit